MYICTMYLDLCYSNVETFIFILTRKIIKLYMQITYVYITNYTLIRQLINVNSKYELYVMLHRKYLRVILIDILKLKFTKTNKL